MVGAEQINIYTPNFEAGALLTGAPIKLVPIVRYCKIVVKMVDISPIWRIMEIAKVMNVKMVLH